MKEVASNSEQQPAELTSLFDTEAADTTSLEARLMAAEATPTIEITEPQQHGPVDESYPRHMTFNQMTQLQCHGSAHDIEQALRGLMPVAHSLGAEVPFSEDDVAEFPELHRTYMGFLRDRFSYFDETFDHPNLPEELPWE